MQWPVYCDFESKLDTYDGNIGNLDTGQIWDVRTYNNGVVPTVHGQIRNGSMVSDDMSTIYATQSLQFIPARMGAIISFLPGNNNTMPPGSVTLAVSKDQRFTAVMGAHLSVRAMDWYFYIRDAAGFDPVCRGKIDPPMSLDGTKYLIEYSIIGDSITMNINGTKYLYSNSRISPNIGTYCFWEHYYYNKKETSAYSQINRIWAGPAIASFTEGVLTELGR